MRAAPWVIAALAIALLATIGLRRDEPDTTALTALRDSVAVARDSVSRVTVRLAEVDVTLAAVRDTLYDVQESTRLRVAAARQRADAAEGRVRATLDSLGASTASLDSLVVAHADEVASKDAEIAARDRERAILYRRVEVSDTLIASLREQVRRMEAVSVEEAAIREALTGQLRGARWRERAAEGVAVVALVVAAVK